MVYIFKEYKHIFDTPAKREQETAIVNKIMQLLNEKKYDNIYDFINKNQTYQDFLKKNEFENVVKHFGNTLNEEDYKRIQDAMVKLTEKKKDFQKDNIETTNIGYNEFVTHKGSEKTTILDNSHSGMSIERQLEMLQPTQEEFQTSNIEQNTENMIKEMEDSKKESLNLQYLNDINFELLNNKQKKVFRIMVNYQLDMRNPIRVDIDREIIVDNDDNILKIERNNGEITIVGANNENKGSVSKEEVKEPKTFQKTLIPSPNTIYSTNN